MMNDCIGWVFCELAFALFKQNELWACAIARAKGKPLIFSSFRARIAAFFYRIGCDFYSRDDSHKVCINND